MKLPFDVKENQKNLLAKEYSAIELVETYLARIDRIDKRLNSFITISEEEARKGARLTDEKISASGEKAIKQYPLLGTVVAHKDLFLTKGIRTTAGSNVLKDYTPPYSSTAVNRFEEAGAIIIGKTNQDAWAHGASGENSDFGPTKNPWNEEYVPGGSSSGSAAAVAAGLSLVSTGTDTGGSVRQPASFTNTVGLKPTYGAVSRYGVIAMASSLDTVGHITRTVEDSETIYNTVKGPDGRDSTVTRNKIEAVRKGSMKIGLPRQYFSEGIDSEVKDIVMGAVKVLEEDGAEIVEINLPRTEEAISVYYIVQPAEVSSNLSRYDGVRYGQERTSFGDEAKRRIMLGTYVLSAGYYDAYYLKAMKVRSLIIQDFDEAFKKVDLIASPVSPTPPFKLGEKVNDPLQMYLSDALTVPASLAGIPGISVPAGFTSTGLPVGLQLMGERFSEALLFYAGKRFQEITEHNRKEPIV